MAELLEEFSARSGHQRVAGIGSELIDISYQRAGKAEAPVALLIMGLAAQSIAWPDLFCNELLARGLQVIRFDNRDAGQSTHMTAAATPDFPAVMKGDFSTVPY